MVAFPLYPEHLEVVFSHLDGRSLWNCAAVCTLWKDVVDRLTTSTKVWKMCCLEEMDVDVLHDIQSNLFPDLWSSTSKEDNDKWHTIYKCWFQWKITKTWQYVSKSTCSTRLQAETVNCLKVSGTCIVTGHEFGVVLVWDYNQGLLGIVTKHITSVTSLELISIPGKKKGRIRGSEVKHDYVISTSRDRTTYLYPLRLEAYPRITIAKHESPATSLSVFQDKFLIAEEDKLSVWKLLPNSNERFYKCMFKHTERTVLLDVLKLCDKYIAGVTLCNRLYVLGWEDKTSKRFFSQPEKRFRETSTYVVRKYFWRPWVYAWLTSHHFLYIALKENMVQYNTIPHLNAYPTALLLYGSVFLIGADSGTVYMYVIESANDLLHLDLSKPRMICSLSTEPILHLDMADDKAEPIIVAATGKSMHYISLWSPK